MTNYDPTVWVNDSAPAINASALNHMEGGIQSAHTELASAVALLASTIDYASAISANVGAQGSAISAQASTIYGQGVAIGSLIAADVAIGSQLSYQAGIVASSEAALATALPILAANASAVAAQASTVTAHGSQLAAHSSQIAFHGSAISELVATTTALATTIDFYGPQLAALDAIASAIVQQGSQLAVLGPLPAAIPFPNRSGRGPVDLWDAETVVGVTMAYGDEHAVGMVVVPKEDWPVTAFNYEQSSNDFTPTPLGQFSFGVLDELGAVVTYSVPTTVPSVGASSIVESISVPAAVPSVVLNAGARYFIVAASDDPGKFRPVGKTSTWSKPLHQRGLAYDWPLPSGLALATYGSLPLNIASSLPPENGLPAIFVT